MTTTSCCYFSVWKSPMKQIIFYFKYIMLHKMVAVKSRISYCELFVLKIVVWLWLTASYLSWRFPAEWVNMTFYHLTVRPCGHGGSPSVITRISENKRLAATIIVQICIVVLCKGGFWNKSKLAASSVIFRIVTALRDVSVVLLVLKDTDAGTDIAGRGRGFLLDPSQDDEVDTASIPAQVSQVTKK